MTDIAPSPSQPARQLTLTATAGIALVTFVIGLLIAAYWFWSRVLGVY